MRKKQYNSGMSLLEILVVVTIFAMLGIVITSSIILTLRGTKKSESLLKVRESMGYATSVMERNIRNSDAIDACPFEESPVINYSDTQGDVSSFECINVGTDGYIASGSARITGDEISITKCSFSCLTSDGSIPPTIKIDVSGKNKQATGVEASEVSLTTHIQLRTY